MKIPASNQVILMYMYIKVFNCELSNHDHQKVQCHQVILYVYQDSQEKCAVDGSVPRRSDPAVRRWSRPADSKHFDKRRGDQDSSLSAVKFTRVETLRASWGLKAIPGKMPAWCQGPYMNHHSQVCESHWARFMSFCRSKRWHVFRVRSYVHDAPLQRRTSPIDDNITSHVCGFCATSLGVWSSSRFTHQTSR